jgi:hypothetical protein
MKTPFFTTCVTALCVLLASCYPYPENPQRKKANQAAQKPTAQEQATLKEQEELKKTEVAKKKAEEAASQATPPTNPDTVTPPPPPTPAIEQKRPDYPFANKVPGKEGFVFSPYNQKVVDVRELPSGTLVQDPTYPAADKKYFRVP